MTTSPHTEFADRPTAAGARIELSAGTIDYADTGGDGAVLVLLHGLLMDASLWDGVIAALSAPGSAATPCGRCAPRPPTPLSCWQRLSACRISGGRPWSRGPARTG